MMGTGVSLFANLVVDELCFCILIPGRDVRRYNFESVLFLLKAYEFGRLEDI